MNKDECEKALEEVRKAYRLIFEYEKRVDATMQYIAKAISYKTRKKPETYWLGDYQ